MRYIRACVYFCLLSIRCFNVVQPETRFHFQSVNQIAKKGQNFTKFTKNKKKFKKNSKLSKISQDFKMLITMVAYFVEYTVEKFEKFLII